MFIPFKLITNCPVATALFIWNKTASLFSSTSFLYASVALETISEKMTTKACSDAFLLLFADVSHSGTLTSCNWHVWHPWTVRSVSLISLSMAVRNSSWFWLLLHSIPGNFIEKSCFISFGGAFPVKENYIREG